MSEFPALKDAMGKLDAARKSLAEVMAEAKTDGGAYDMDRIKSVGGDKAAKLEWIQAKNAELAPLKAEVEKYKSIKLAADNADEYNADQNGGADEYTPSSRQVKSVGELFVKSQAFKRKGDTAHLDVDMKTLFRRPAGWTPEVTRSGLVTLMPMIPAPSVVDHLPSLPVTQTSYKYMEETTYTNNAAEIAEATSSEAPYGEAALALTERSQTVEKVAVWIPMTDEQLEDEPGARAYVEARLENMLRQRIDLQVLAGSGSSNNLLGTVNKGGIQTQALGADTLLDASYKLFTTIRTDGFAEPSVAFLNAAAWQPVMLLKSADGIYIWGNPAAGGPSTLWGVPVVQTQAAPATKMVTGDYANYGFIGVKRGIDVQVTNSHSTDFINGRQAVRMDTRLVMVHIRPKAFGVVTGL